MEPQRLGSAAGGGVIGALIGVLVSIASIWWPDSAPVGTTVAYATAWGGPGLRPGDSCLGVGRRSAHVPLVNLQQPLDPRPGVRGCGPPRPRRGGCSFTGPVGQLTVNVRTYRSPARNKRSQDGREHRRLAGVRCGTAIASMAGTRRLISCRHCHRPIALVHDVGETALTVMATHLRGLHPQEEVGEHPGPEAILPHFRITPAGSDDDPPDTA